MQDTTCIQTDRQAARQTSTHNYVRLSEQWRSFSHPSSSSCSVCLLQSWRFLQTMEYWASKRQVIHECATEARYKVQFINMVQVKTVVLLIIVAAFRRLMTELGFQRWSSYCDHWEDVPAMLSQSWGRRVICGVMIFQSGVQKVTLWINGSWGSSHLRYA